MAESSIKNLFTCTTRHCHNVDKNKVSNEYATQYKNLQTIKCFKCGNSWWICAYHKKKWCVRRFHEALKHCNQCDGSSEVTNIPDQILLHQGLLIDEIDQVSNINPDHDGTSESSNNTNREMTCKHALSKTGEWDIKMCACGATCLSSCPVLKNNFRSIARMWQDRRKIPSDFFLQKRKLKHTSRRIFLASRSVQPSPSQAQYCMHFSNAQQLAVVLGVELKDPSHGTFLRGPPSTNKCTFQTKTKEVLLNSASTADSSAPSCESSYELSRMACVAMYKEAAQQWAGWRADRRTLVHKREFVWPFCASAGYRRWNQQCAAAC